MASSRKVRGVCELASSTSSTMEPYIDHVLGCC